MGNLHVFENVTLDGYFTGEDGDLSWAHARGGDDEDWNDFIAGNASRGGTLLLGRKTFEMMKAYWPTPQAKKEAPEVAAGMNRMQKVVVSRTLDDPGWSNTEVINGDLAEEVRKLKQAADNDITILGSGSIVAQLAAEGLIDDYQVIVNPVVLGKGRSLFEGVEQAPNLKLLKTRAFKNGNVLLSYEAEN
ncbi:MAG TPA: dihydrofolate reductase family protein [Thermoanaerobaculia bacterium]|jgi:dihydrofolate reductase|nr:dihydrofolate reductase family protein [Thermoanaerobaculia bacterium]